MHNPHVPPLLTRHKHQRKYLTPSEERQRTTTIAYLQRRPRRRSSQVRSTYCLYHHMTTQKRTKQPPNITTKPITAANRKRHPAVQTKERSEATQTDPNTTQRKLHQKKIILTKTNHHIEFLTKCRDQRTTPTRLQIQK